MSKKQYQKLSNNQKAMQILSACVDKNLDDKQIQKILNDEIGYFWNTGSIRRQRLKISENVQNNSVDEKSSLSSPPPGLNQEEKADWFRKQFKKSHLYSTLKEQLTKIEVETYLQEYGSLCCQFEDIVFSEFFQIDDFLKHRILINRQLTIMKQAQELIDELTQWIANNPDSEELSKDKKDERREKYRTAQETKDQLRKANDRYDKLAAERQKIYNNLAATRKDRVEELKGGKESFFSLVSLLQSSESERNKQGQFAELTKIASEDIKKQLRKPTEFPDSEMDVIILDAEAVEDIEDE